MTTTANTTSLQPVIDSITNLLLAAKAQQAAQEQNIKGLTGEDFIAADSKLVDTMIAVDSLHTALDYTRRAEDLRIKAGL